MLLIIASSPNGTNIWNDNAIQSIMKWIEIESDLRFDAIERSAKSVLSSTEEWEH